MEQIKVSVSMVWVGVVDATADFVVCSYSAATQAEPLCDRAKPIARQFD